MSIRKKILLSFFVLVLAGITGLALHNVPRTLTDNDREYVGIIMREHGYDLKTLQESADDFEGQIALIKAVQSAILGETPEQKLIPVHQPREPKNLHDLGYAQCGDRSRFMEKAFQIVGLSVRFASLYSQKNTRFPLFRAGDKKLSHALVEVKTVKGWIIVDSVKPWIGLTQEGHPVSLAEWPHFRDEAWQSAEPYFLLEDDFIYLYGFYSRHGLFYPPYTPYIPDINWPTFLTQNWM